MGTRIISAIIDQIPLWVYLVVGGLSVAAALYFASPILIPLWNITPKPVKIALGVIGLAFATYVLGRNKGAKDAKLVREKLDARAVETRHEIDRKVDARSPSDIDRDLERWMRD